MLPILLFFCFATLLLYHALFYRSDLQRPGHLLPGHALIIVDALTLLVLLYMCFFPKKVVIYSFLGIMNGMITTINGNAIEGCLFFNLAVAFLLRSRRINTIYSAKVLILFVPYFGSLILLLHVGFSIFMDELVHAFFVLVFTELSVILLNPFFSFSQEHAHHRHIDLSGMNLNPRDCDFIKSALVYEKYDSIANRYGISASTVKQRMCAIYRMLDVRCRDEFLIRYSNSYFTYPVFKVSEVISSTGGDGKSDR